MMKFWDWYQLVLGLRSFLAAKEKNPADVKLRGFRMVEAEVGIEPA